jgi:ABC-type uncharacterized transport system fused permease/ATPase subunit
MDNLKWQGWQAFWRVAQPYWVSVESRGAIALLGAIILLSIASSGLVVLETLQRGEVVSALVAQKLDRFGQATVVFGGILALMIPGLALKNYLQARLSLHWRRWLSDRYLNRYFSNQSFYHLGQISAVDNPDQRIAQDIDNFTQQSLLFVVLVTDSSLQLAGFVSILWRVSPVLMAMLLGYVILGTGLTTLVFGRVMVRINRVQLQREADFRYGLARVRDNAEAIAFYQGEIQERNQVWQRFQNVFQTINRLLRWQWILTVAQNSYQYLTFLLPFVVLAPRIFSGELEVGAVTQSQAAFERLGAIFGLIIMQFDKLSAFGAGILRLDQLDAAMTQLGTRDRTLATIETVIAPNVQIQHLTLAPPSALAIGQASQRDVLLRDLSLTVAPDQSLLIMGASGFGKTSLLRAIAGLWQTGSGTIARPERSHLLFLPQRPYLMVGSLRQQLLYPHFDRAHPDAQLENALEHVRLAHLLHGGDRLDAVADWAHRLSGGEQQRLAFARLLLSQPHYALLDEATSALDDDNEAHLYTLLQSLLCGIIRVGHRPSLLAYHQQVLHLQGAGCWQLLPTESDRA